MSITDVKFVRGFIRMCNDGWEQGWHERNGGNLSCRMKEGEVEEVKEYLSADGEWREIGTSVPGLAGECFYGNRQRKIGEKGSVRRSAPGHLSRSYDQCDCPHICTASEGRGICKGALGDGDRVSGGIPVRDRRSRLDGSGWS